MSTTETLARIIVDDADDIGKELEIAIDGHLSEEAFAFAVDVDPDHVRFLGDDNVRNIAANPVMCALCHATADRLFAALGPALDETAYEFKAAGTPDQNKLELARSAKELAAAVRTTLANHERAVFKIKRANHEFILVARNGRAEVFQSFMTRYTLGSCLKHNEPYAADMVEPLLLLALAGNGALGKQAQEYLFFEELHPLPNIIFEYRKRTLFDDDTIRGNLAERMRKALEYYKSITV